MTAYTVVTIATADGARSEETGRALAERLGYRYVNEDVIARAAELAGVTPEEIARAEHSEPLLTRLMSSMAGMVWADGSWLPDADMALDQTPAYRAMIRAAIDQVASAGRAVIVAHGAGMQLAGRSEVLRVWVTASPEVRAARIAEQHGISRAAARRRVEKGDAERAAYLRRFYEVKDERASSYDLVVSTDRLTPTAAARIIAGAAREPEPEYA
jgi:cytidylate kinase